MLEMEEFRMQLKKLIVSCGLNTGEVYFILKDVLTEVQKAYFDSIQKELDERKKSEEKASEDKTS